MQVLSAVATPERLMEFCCITTEQLAQKLSSLAMRLAYLLGADREKASWLQVRNSSQPVPWLEVAAPQHCTACPGKCTSHQYEKHALVSLLTLFMEAVQCSATLYRKCRREGCLPTWLTLLAGRSAAGASQSVPAAPPLRSLWDSVGCAIVVIGSFPALQLLATAVLVRCESLQPDAYAASEPMETALLKSGWEMGGWGQLPGVGVLMLQTRFPVSAQKSNNISTKVKDKHLPNQRQQSVQLAPLCTLGVRCCQFKLLLNVPLLR